MTKTVGNIHIRIVIIINDITIIVTFVIVGTIIDHCVGIIVDVIQVIVVITVIVVVSIIVIGIIFDKIIAVVITENGISNISFK